MIDEDYYRKIINLLNDIQDNLLLLGQEQQYKSESAKMEPLLKAFYKVIYQGTSNKIKYLFCTKSKILLQLSD